jgi:hypothetical protein
MQTTYVCSFYGQRADSRKIGHVLTDGMHTVLPYIGSRVQPTNHNQRSIQCLISLIQSKETIVSGVNLILVPLLFTSSTLQMITPMLCVHVYLLLTRQPSFGCQRFPNNASLWSASSCEEREHD